MSVQWYWADDSPTGSQDVWTKYSDDLNTRIEKAHSKQQKTTKIDDERFIDFSTMTQRRRDDKNKMRAVIRVTGSNPPPPPNAASESTTSSSSSSSSSSTVTRSKVKKADPGEDGCNLDTDDSDVEVEWFWYGDSPGGGHQDIRIGYNPKVNASIEASFQRKEKKYPLDAERYLDFKEMTQRRFDDKNKRRMVVRTKKRVPKPVIPAPAPVISPPAPVIAAPAPVSSPPVSLPPVISPPASSSSSSSSSTLAPIKPKVDDDEGSCTDSDSERTIGSKSKGKSNDKPVKKQKLAAPGDDSEGSVTEDEDETAKKGKKKAKGEEEEEKKKKEEEEEDEEDREEVSWFWAGDSAGGGHQDVNIEYDAVMSKKFEDAYLRGDKEVKVDNERYIDLRSTPFLQRRYDDPSKRRTVKRIVKTIVSPKKPKPIKQELKIDQIKLDDANTKITNISSSSKASSDSSSSSSDGLSSSSSSLNLKKLGHQSLPGCPATWSDEEGMDYYELTVKEGTDEWKKFSKMLTETVADYHLNNPSNHKVTFSKLVPTKIQRVQNPALWLRYYNRRQKITQSNPNLKTINKVATGAASDAPSNEFYLFHGLNHCFLDEITQFGFDPRHCSLDGMFGAGLYFADLSTKSNQYSHSGACKLTGMAGLGKQNQCHCKKTDEVCLLLCRVVLGDPHIEIKFQGNAPGQFWHGRRKEPSKSDGTIYNSVIGESKTIVPGAYLMGREYIVYESSQVYPEYKIYYKRA